MIFTETPLEGAYVVDLERRVDQRGFFARSWCQVEFQSHGLNPRLVQCDVSFSYRSGTLRGMHYQVEPLAEAKLIRCTMGSVHDVIVDLRPTSSSFMHHFSVTLTSENRRMLFMPEGFAHGFLTLSDNSEVFYQMSDFYAPECERGFRWNDPAFGITWPTDVRVVSERDRNYPDFVLGS